MQVSSTQRVTRNRVRSLYSSILLLAFLLLAANRTWSQVNLAQGKTVTSSSILNAGTNPNSNLVDGDFSTIASTNNTTVPPNGEWFLVDLGADHFIDSVVIGCNPAQPNRLRRFLLVTWSSNVAGAAGLGTNPTSYVNNSLYNRLEYQNVALTSSSNVAVAASGTGLGPAFPGNLAKLHIGQHKARYVMIINLQDDIMDATELQVFATKKDPVRSFTNGGFETGFTTPSFGYAPEGSMPGWSTTEMAAVTNDAVVPTQGSILEIWRSGFNSVPAYQGTYFAELNAFTNGMLEQEAICVLPGETFDWSFAHRGRSGVDVMRLRINEVDVAEFSDNNAQAGTHTGTVLSGGTATTTINASHPTGTNGWTLWSGNWTNNTGSSQIVTFGFRAVSGAGGISQGNFLDAVTLSSLSVLVKFNVTNASGPEVNASGNLNKLVITGTLSTASTVELNITGGTATRGVDYTTNPATGPIVINIPAGNYDGTVATGISLAPYIQIKTDLVNPEPDETIIAELQNPSGLVAVGDPASCTDAGTQQMIYTIINSLPVTANIAHTDVKCFNGKDGTATATGAGGSGQFKYSWNTVPVQVTATATGLAAGAYTVTVIDTIARDTITANVTIAQPAAALAATGTVTNTSGPNLTDGAINLTVTGGTGTPTYVWSNGATTEDLAAIGAGTYTVVATDQNSCVVRDTFLVLATPAAYNVTNAAKISNAVTTGVTIDSLKSADQDGNVVSYTISTLPPAAQGTLTLDNGTPVTAGQVITPAAAKTLRFLPNASYTGQVTFTFTATDNDALTDATPATYTINVGTPPVANNVTMPTPVSNQDSNVPIPGLSATDADGTISSYTVSTLPPAAQGVLSLADGSAVTAGQVLTPTQAANLRFTATGNYTGPVNFTFTATDNDGFTDATPATYTLNVIRPASDLSITKTASPKPATPGEGLTYTITLLNNGPGALLAADSLTVTDNLPSGFTATSYTASNGTFTSANGIWTGLTLASGQSATLSIAGNIAASATGSLVNTAGITIPPGINDPTPGNNNDTDTTELEPKPVLTVVKTGQASLTAGNLATYTIVVKNTGSSNAVGATIRDTVPAGFTAVSWSSTTAGAASVTSGGTGNGNVVLLTANIPTGAANSVTITVTGTLSAGATGSINNTATVIPAETGGTGGSSTFSSSVTSTPGITIVKTSPAQDTAGGTLSYSIEVGNNGPSNATGTIIRDTVPAALTNVTWSTQQGGAAVVTAGASGAGNIIAVTGNIPAGAANKITVNITGTVSPAYSGQLTNIAHAIPQEPGTTPVTDDAITNITRQPAFTISKTGPASLQAGQQVQYIITAKNTGLSNSTGTVISDIVSSNINNVSWVATAVSGTANITAGATGTGNNVAVTADFNAGSEVRVTVSGTVNPAFSGSITNSGIVTPSEPGIKADTSSVVTTVDRTPSLAIQKSGPATIKAGQPITYTLTLTNTGTSNAVGAEVRDTIPAGIGAVSWTSSVTGTATVTTGASGSTSILSLKGDIPAGSGNSIVITVTGTVDPSQVADLVNTAVVIPSEPGTTPVPSAPVTTTVTREPKVTLHKTGADTAIAGQQITYQVEAINDGPSDANGIVITDAIPAGLTNISWVATAAGTSVISSGATGTGNSLSVTSDLKVGSANKVSIAITGTVPAGMATGAITNFAVATPAEPGIPPVNSDTVKTEIVRRNKIQVVKSGPTQMSSGETVTYVLTLSNSGPSDAIGAVITDAVPVEFTNVAWSTAVTGTAVVTAGATGAGNAVSVTGNLPAGSGNTILVTITGRLPQSYTGGDIKNAAVATPSEPGNPPVNSDTVTTVINRRADLAIVKTGPQTATAGQSVTYTITVTNNGPSNVTNAVISDVVPAGIVNTSWTAVASAAATVSAPSGTGNNINLTASIPAGGIDNVVITVNGTLNPTYPGNSIFNTATVTPPTGVTDPTPASSTVVTTVNRTADVRVSKIAPSNAGAGEAITYQLRIINDGLTTAAGTTINDVVSSSISNVSWTVTASSGATSAVPSGTGNTINFLADIPKGGIILVDITGTALSSLTDGTVIPNTVTATVAAGITDANPADNTATVNTTIDNNATFRVSKAGPGSVKVGDPITYTMVIDNVGAGDITAANITDDVPLSVSVSSWTITGTNASVNAGFPSSGTSNTINTQAFLGGTNGKLTITVNGTVAANALATFTNTINVEAGGNRQASITTAVNRSTDIAISKSGPFTVAAGHSITYTIIARNDGAVAANGLVINDVIPATIQNPTWSATASGTALINGAASGTGDISMNVDIPAGSANMITITVTGNIPANTLPSSISNTASLDMTGTGLSDSNPGNNSSTVNTSITNEPALTVHKSGPSKANAGEQITYSVLVENLGASDATNVSIGDIIPVALQSVSWSAVPQGSAAIVSGATGTGNNLALTANIPAGTGNSVLITITGTINPSFVGTINNIATASVNNRTAQSPVVTTEVAISANLRVTKSGPATVVAGQPLTYTVEVNNFGPSALAGSVITDAVPAMLTNVSWSSAVSGNAVVTSGATGTGNSLSMVANLPAGGRIVITINGDVPSGASGSINNTATVTPNEAGVPPANSNTVTTTVSRVPNLSFTKSAPTAASSGEKISYQLILSNTGPSDALNTTITDNLPAGLTAVSWTATATKGASIVSGVSGTGNVSSIVNIPVGGEVSVVISGTIDQTFNGNLVNTATATPSEPGVPALTATATTTVTPKVNISISKSGPVQLTAGQNIAYQLRVRNSGPSLASKLAITDIISPDITNVQWTATASGAAVITSGGSGTGNNLAVEVDLPSAAADEIVINITGVVNSSFAGIISNSAIATPSQPGSVPDTSTITTNVSRTPVLAIVKTGDAFTTNGGAVHYRITVSNTSSSDAVGAVITDAVPAGIENVSWTTTTAGTAVVTAGATGTGNAVSITANIPAGAANTIVVDITGTVNSSASGYLVNQATATPSEPGTTPVTSEEVKTAIKPVGVADADSTLVNTPVTIPVKNNDPNSTGYNILKGTDPNNGSIVVNADGTITYTPAPGFTGVDTFTYRLQTSLGILSDPITVRVTVYTATFTLEKTATAVGTKAGELIRYSILVTNTGQVALQNIVITDAGADPGSINPATVPSLAVGANTTVTASHTLTQAEIDAGRFSNQAKGSGEDPRGNPVTDTLSDDPATPTSNDSTITNIPAAAGITLVKAGALSASGDSITYNFTIQNTGNVTLNNLVLNDAKLGLVNEPVPGTLAPNGSTTFTKVYVLTQADKDAGSVTNTAITTGQTPGGGTVTDTSGTTGGNNTPTVVPVPSTPGITLVKAGALSASGDSITYNFTIQNTGNVTLNNLVLNDAKLGLVNEPVPGTLAPNGSTTFTKVYVLTQADKDAGSVTNTATGTGQTPGGGTVTDTSGTTGGNNTPTVVPVPSTPGITLVKAGALSASGDSITYSFTIQNTGNVTLSNLLLNDAKLGLVNEPVPGTLAPNGSTTFTKVYVLTQADKDAGSVTNTATGTGQTPGGGTVTDTSGTTGGNNTPTVVPVPSTPGITLVKAGALSASGDSITYSFTIQNTGNVTLNNLVLNDAKLGLVNEPVPGTLAPNGSTTFTKVYVLTQADKDAGSVTNTATGTGQTPGGGTVTDTSGTTGGNNTPTVVPVPSTPGITLVKAGALSASGDSITYSFTIQNTGNVTLNNLVLNDAKLGLVNEPVPGTLAPNGSTTFTKVYVLTQADKDAGSVTNTATGTGQTPGGGTVTDTSGTTGGNNTPTVVPVPSTPGITLVKAGALSASGDSITYNFTIQNTGNVTLSNLLLNDAKLGLVNEPVPGTLAPNGSTTFTKVYVLTQADKDAGSVTNTATGTGQTPGGGTVTDTSGTTGGNNTPTVVPVPSAPGISLVKTGSLSTDGSSITYTFTLRNTGNVTLSNLTLNDAKLGMSNEPVPGTLAPGGSTTFTRTYTLTQADINAGSVTNTANTTGQTPGGGTVTDTSGTTGDNNTPTVVPVPSAPGISLVKTGAVSTDGSSITYTFTLRNTGNVTLSNLTLNDAKLGMSNEPVPGTLAPGASTTFTRTYTLTQADINAGSVTNTANTTGQTPGGGTVTDTSGTTGDNNTPTVVPVPSAPGISLVKTGALSTDGSSITYTFTLRNTGNVTLSNLTLNDAKLGMSNEPVPGTLAPGGSTTFTRTYTLTQADINAGSVTNTANTTGQTPGGGTVTDTSGTTGDNNTPTVVPVPSAPGISLVKTGAVSADGITITYTFTIRNTGNVALSNLTLTDAKLGMLDEAIPGSLAPGASTTFTRTYTLTSADINTGSVTNTATVTGQTPDGRRATDVSGTLEDNDTPTLTPVPALELLIPNVITPNGDGMNDRFVIKGLQRYPGSGIYIYNRWGNMVYQNKNYDNTWDGNGLNEGTYYYILKLNTPQGEKVHKGWIELLR